MFDETCIENNEKTAPTGKSVARKKAPFKGELVGPGMGHAGNPSSTSTPPADMLRGKKRKSDSATSSINKESGAAAAKKSKMMASSEANQPVQKPSVPQPRPRPVTKKATAANSEADQPVQKPSVPRPRPCPVAKKAGGESSAAVSQAGNAQEPILDTVNKTRKRSNPTPTEDNLKDGNATDTATPVRPLKKVKSGAHTARPLQRTGIFVCYFLYSVC